MNAPVLTKHIPAPDLVALKAKQNAAWSSGDYAVVGSTLQIVGETLCEAMDLRAGQKVLDVAAGNGNATLAAARRWCRVTSTDYVAKLLEGGKARAAANGFDNIEFIEADVEALPFDDDSFDAVLSTYGVMFTANHEQAAAEMLRVCRPGGKIVILNHFLSTNRVLAWLERSISPFTVHIGFKSDLDLGALIAQAELRPASIEKINFPRIWSLVTCLKD